jgi:hypothetical protein
VEEVRRRCDRETGRERERWKWKFGCELIANCESHPAKLTLPTFSLPPSKSHLPNAKPNQMHAEATKRSCSKYIYIFLRILYGKKLHRILHSLPPVYKYTVKNSIEAQSPYYYYYYSFQREKDTI